MGRRRRLACNGVSGGAAVSSRRSHGWSWIRWSTLRREIPETGTSPPWLLYSPSW
ncbi:unnamed protein product [Spirodela intermedia]|uniref:Uncharacterized protein n=1 Tax=Spirodela intermedia TaxID=51605 RepID=A0A7I8IV72_SPIIN|nr:unnamed protein product [Spirodela intermedia]CAA6661886.1 unnamed protein product [Spirodela intermedia]